MHDLIQHYVIADEKFLCTKEFKLVLLSTAELEDFSLEASVAFPFKNHLQEDVRVIYVDPKESNEFQWVGLRNLLDQLSEEEFQMAGRALQIIRWHFDHQFCGRCGKSTVQHSQDFAKTCLHCAIDFYPRLSPCIIALVTRGDECLLAWHARSKEEKYSCLAGFIEVGESPEQTLAREVMEEVGLSVNNCRYIASQPWPFPGQLMLGYFAEYVSGDINEDKREIIKANWYNYNHLPRIPPSTTISGRLINTFIQERHSIHINHNSKIR